MKCPQCGTEFEAEVKQCFTCGWDFNENPADFIPRRSKLAVFSLVLGILCIFTLYLPLLAAVIVGIAAIRKIRKSRGKLTGERIAMSGILVPVFSLPIFFLIGYVIWSKDAGPVPNEFTEADFVQVRPENEASWDLLLQLNAKSDDPDGAPAIGLTQQNIEQLSKFWEIDSNTVEKKYQFIREHADDIKSLWRQSEKGRTIIEELNTYDEIADLTEPSLEAKFPFLQNIKLLGQINVLQSLLLLENNEIHEACQQLIAYDTFVRKFGMSSRSLISKLVSYAVFNMNLDAANLIVNHPNITNEELLLLQAHFSSFREEHIRLKNSFIYEYLIFKNAMIDVFGNVDNPLYKYNSICRYYDGFCRNLILKEEGKAIYDYCQVSVWPWEKPNSPKVSLDLIHVVDDYFSSYFFYNPIGMMQIAIFMPAVEKSYEIKENISVRRDLFQWVLARRMGEVGSLKARAYGDEYMVDVEKGLVFSVGPDGEPYTDDDIKMRIDPEVLGLK